jgi:hypothetical protein
MWCLCNTLSRFVAAWALAVAIPWVLALLSDWLLTLQWAD